MSVSKQILERINDRIAKSIKEGKKPWRKQWQEIPFDNLSLSSPVNLVSKTRYQGFNRFILGLHPSTVPVFMTFEQIKKLKGSVKKGAESLPVIYFSKTKVETTQEETLTEKTVVFLKYYNVFNIEDTTIQLEDLIQNLPEPNSHEKLEAVEPVINDYLSRENIPVRNSLHENFYRPISDEIHMVDINQFKTPEEYYSVFLHEIVHSTGHQKRLDRLKLKPNRDKDYAFEELVAETAACYLTAHLNIANDKLLDNSSAYIRSWLTALESNPYFFYQAAKQAEIAANYVLKAA